MRRRWRQWAICALIAVAGAVGARTSGNISFFELLHLKVLDAHFALRGRQPTSKIVMVVADQKALDTFPELKAFWHPYYARAIKAAGEAGARVVGLDHAFGIPVDKWEPDDDRLMASAVGSSPIPVIVGYVPSLNTNQQTLPVPVNLVAAALGLSGYANLTTDPDTIVRRQELMEAPSPDPNAPPPARSFALRIAEKYLGQDVQFSGGHLMLEGKPLPVDADRALTINYAGPPNTFPRISLVDFLAAADKGDLAQLRRWVQGKIVLIGTDDNTADDRYPTPYYTARVGTDWLTPGVEIHANTIRTILNRDFLLPVPEWVRMLALLGAAGLTVSITIFFRTPPAIAWMLTAGAATLLGTHLLFLKGYILSTSEMLLAMVMCLFGAIVYRFATAEKRGDLFRKAVSLFVGRQLATSLDETGKVVLSGKKMMVTILFTDIRSFTAFSEQLCDEQGPEALVKMLNEYMTMMVAIIVTFRGHVNKFIGDGILAVFSDDDEGSQPGDHALRAVQCATRMVTAPSQFKTGAGIHTGVAVVGNVGSAEKMEFTVLGDTVNLASRLESLNKEHKTRLLMSGSTYEMLGGQVKAVELGAVPVRGKTVPIALYTVAALVTPEKEPVHA